MARPKSTQPTDGELELLKILWESGPTELGRICAELRRQRPVATTTVATMLTVMLGKGLVKRMRGTGDYVWSAKIDRETTNRKLVDKLIDRVFDGSAQLLVAHLVQSKKLSDAESKQILELLNRSAANSSGKNKPASDSNDSKSSK